MTLGLLKTALKSIWRRACALLIVYNSPLFDADFYLGQGARAGRWRSVTIVHYLWRGRALGLRPHPLFDPAWYLETYPEVAAARLEPLAHYLEVGATQGFRPHPLFDSAWYLERHPEVAAPGLNPLVHYLEVGAAQGFRPHPLFDSAWYLERHPEVAAAGLNPLIHYLLYGAAQGLRPHPLFDPAGYPEVAGAGGNPLIHYLEAGALQGVRPHRLFDPAYYLRHHPEVAGRNPLLHYLEEGSGRDFAPHPLFDPGWYRRRHPEVAAAGQEPLAHYLEVGIARGFSPHPLFDPAYYLRRYPEVAAAGQEPLFHYLLHGAAQGLRSHPLFDPVWYLESHPEAAGADPLIHYLEDGAFRGFRPHRLFDPAYYLRHHPEVAGRNPLLHYLEDGSGRDFAPHPLFDPGWYRRRHPEVAAAGQEPLAHYLEVGIAGGFSPHPLFDPAYYLRRYPEVAAAGQEPLFHYLLHGAAQGLRSHPLFDPVWYLESHPEAAGADPLIHYLEDGAFRGFRPHRLFDPAYYLRHHPEVAGRNPLLHYLEDGSGRDFAPHPLFDPGWYRGRHPEIAAAGQEPLSHYLEQGTARGFSPHPLFDPGWYLERYAEIGAAGREPLRHYLEHGADEGRWPNRFFDGGFYLRGHPGVANPLIDYLETGEPPHPLFDPAFYRRRYPEAVAGGADPLADYLAATAAGEDRDPFPIPASLRSLKPLLLAENLADLEPPPTGNPFRRLLADLAGLETPAAWPAAAWYDGQQPEVSILIINYNNAALTVLCLQALWAFTTGHSYEVVVLDNGSRDEDVAVLTAFPGRYRLVRTPVNRFFGEGNNLALEAARGRFVVFLNNDALVTPGWLEPLLAVFERDPGAVAVGPQLLYLSGRLQEAGAMLDPEGEPVRLGWGGRADDPAFGRTRVVDYCSAAALVCRRPALEAVAGFDWCWEPLYFEDVDLCLRLRQGGGRVLYCPDSHLYHIENASTRRLDRTREIDRIVAINRLKFRDRWHEPAGAVGADVITVPAAPEPLTSRTPRVSRPLLTILADFPWRPGAAMRAALEIAVAAGDDFEVCLLTPQPWSRLRLIQMMTALGLPAVPVRVAPSAGGPVEVFVAFGPAPALGRRNLLVSADGSAPPLPEGFQMLPVVPVSRYGQVFATVRQPLIVSVGRFAPGAGQDERVRWFRTGLEDGLLPAGTTLALAGVVAPEPGDRALFDQVRDLARDLPVRLYPNASHRRLLALYRDAALAWPAGPLTALEAMSAGALPLIAAGSAAAALIEPGLSGFVWSEARELLEISGRLLAATGTPAGKAASRAARDRAEALHPATPLRALLAAGTGHRPELQRQSTDDFEVAACNNNEIR